MTVDLLTAMLDGGRVTLCVIVAIGFVRLSRVTRDRLYAAFAVAFLLLGVNWTLLGVQTAGGDHSVLAFVPRLLAFLLIIAAIVDKNRRAGRG